MTLETAGVEFAAVQQDQKQSLRPATYTEQRGPEVTHSTKVMKAIGVAGAAVATTLVAAATIAEARGYHVSTLIQHAVDFIRPAIDHTPNPQPGIPPIPPGR